MRFVDYSSLLRSGVMPSLSAVLCITLCDPVWKTLGRDGLLWRMCSTVPGETNVLCACAMA